MAAPSTCIACKKPFAENRELAAIPDASKVAFDPAHRRVWRICAGCGEWNLLGAEAAAAALPELEARSAAVTSSSAPELGFAPARVSGRLEIVRVGAPEMMGRGDPTATRLRKEFDKRSVRLKWLFPVMAGTTVVLVAAWFLFMLLYTHWHLEFPGPLIVDYAAMACTYFVLRWMRGLKVNRGPALISVASLLLGLGSILAVHKAEELRYLLVGLGVALPFFVLANIAMSRYGLVRFRPQSGAMIRFSESAIPRVTLSWTPGGTDISLHDLPKGRTVSGPEVAGLFRLLAPFSFKRGLPQLVVTLNTVTENAYTLLNTLGGLGGLLRALEGFRRDSDGRVLIADLPMIYLVALELALTAGPGDSDTGDAMREKALDAAAVAHEAEELDRN
jgi:hypothetical protein